MRTGLQTERLLLLPSDPRLAEPVTAYFVRNQHFLRPFEPPRDNLFFSVPGQRRLLKREQHEMAAGCSYRFWMVPKDNRKNIIGSVALSGLIRGSIQSSFVAYRTDAALQGCGYATEAMQRLMEFSFEAIHLHRLEANIMPRNKPSLRVAEKLGFINEGLSRLYLNINGAWEDHFRFSIINEGFDQ